MKQGILLINLGSPRSTSVKDVRSYLNEFLMDPYVIDLPWVLRRLVVGAVLVKRPAESAKAYQEIWWPEGSPLIVNGQRLQAKVNDIWDGPVELGMRYVEPSIENAILNLTDQGVEQIIVVPLYPQFAQSTTETALEEVKRVVRKHKLGVDLLHLPAFYGEQEYLDALLKVSQPYFEQDFDHLLFSFHGLPESHLTKIDPTKKHCLKCDNCCSKASAGVLSNCYKAQCTKTAEKLAKLAGLPDDKWSVAFQSRLGRNKWIEPYTEEQLDQFAKSGIKKLLIISPAFVADCIETLEELGLRAKEQFIAAGGESLELIPCLNDDQNWAESLVQLCERKTVQLSLTN